MSPGDEKEVNIYIFHTLSMLVLPFCILAKMDIFNGRRGFSDFHSGFISSRESVERAGEHVPVLFQNVRLYYLLHDHLVSSSVNFGNINYLTNKMRSGMLGISDGCVS